MKTIKTRTIAVKVTYEVELSDIEMPEDVFDELLDAMSEFNEIGIGTIEYPKAAAWILQNIKEKESYSWAASIEDMEWHNSD